MDKKNRYTVVGIGASKAGKEPLGLEVYKIIRLCRQKQVNIPSYESDGDEILDGMVLAIIYNHEMLSEHSVTFDDIYGILEYNEPLPLYSMKIIVIYELAAWEKRCIDNFYFPGDAIEAARAHELYVKDSFWRKRIVFRKLDKTSEFTEGASNYNKMIRQKMTAYFYIKELAKTNKKLTTELIHEIYAHTLTEELSDFNRYRELDAPYSDTIYRPSQPNFIWRSLNKAVEEYNNSNVQDNQLEFIIALTKLFLNLCRITPFDEGEYSYTAVLVLNLELLKAGYPPICIRADDVDEFRKRAETYYGHNNPQPMAYLIALYLQEALEEELSD